MDLGSLFQALFFRLLGVVVALALRESAALPSRSDIQCFSGWRSG
jgi:hypothetical protein